MPSPADEQLELLSDKPEHSRTTPPGDLCQLLPNQFTPKYTSQTHYSVVDFVLTQAVDCLLPCVQTDDLQGQAPITRRSPQHTDQELLLLDSGEWDCRSSQIIASLTRKRDNSQ